MVLLAFAFLQMYATMSPRSRSAPAANPRSALQKLMGVAREHKKRGYKMAPLTLAMQVMAGQLRLYVECHGTDCLAPARKRPLTNDIILRMLSTPDGTPGGALRVDWSLVILLLVGGARHVLNHGRARPAQGGTSPNPPPPGLRRCLAREVDGTPSRLSVGALGASPPPTPPRYSDTAPHHRSGRRRLFIFASLKNDPFGEHFGSKPAWLPFSSAAPRSACRSLVALELAAAALGLVPGARASTPLFGTRHCVAWHHHLIDSVFQFLLEYGAGLSATERTQYSIHS
jgi:hypothetical protein